MEYGCAVGGGRTTIAGSDGNPQTCPGCQGEGQIACEYCRGEGQIVCDQCRGRGNIDCKKCGGAGANSKVAQVKIQARLDGTVDDEGLPGSLQRMLKENPGNIIKSKLAKIQSVNRETNDDKTPVLKYKLEIPYAELTLDFGGKTFRAECAGFNLKFTEIPPILEKQLGPVIEHSGSDRSQSKPISALQKVGGYKIFREAMILTAQASVNAAEAKLGDKYIPLITKEKIRQIALNTSILLDKATKKPRRLATIWTGIMMAALFAGYYYANGPAYLLGLGEDYISMTGIERYVSLPLGIVAVLISGQIHKILSRVIFNLNIGKFLPGEYSALLLVKLSRFHFKPYLVTLIVFAAFYIPLEIFDFLPLLSG